MNDFVEVFIFIQSKDAIFSKYILQVVIGCAALIFGLYLLWKVKREKRETIQLFIAGFVLFWSVIWIGINGSSFYETENIIIRVQVLETE